MKTSARLFDLGKEEYLYSDRTAYFAQQHTYYMQQYRRVEMNFGQIIGLSY